MNFATDPEAFAKPWFQTELEWEKGATSSLALNGLDHLFPNSVRHPPQDTCIFSRDQVGSYLGSVELNTSDSFNWFGGVDEQQAISHPHHCTIREALRA